MGIRGASQRGKHHHGEDLGHRAAPAGGCSLPRTVPSQLRPQPRGGSGSDPPRPVLRAAGPWASREAKAPRLLQVGAALLLAHLPQVQRVVVQQRQEPALGMTAGCGRCWGAAARFPPRIPPRTWPGRKCSWVTVAVSLCSPVSSTPGAPYLGGPSKKQRGWSPPTPSPAKLRTPRIPPGHSSACKHQFSSLSPGQPGQSIPGCSPCQSWP